MPHEQRFQRTKSLLYRYGIWLTVMRLFFCLVHPLLRASGKDEAMKRIPRTPIEFDYDLWTTEDGKCMVRVKSTGEVTEVGREVMKALRAEEKRLRRSFTGEVDDGEESVSTTILSLDSVPDDEINASAWLNDGRDFVREIVLADMVQEFRSKLTKIQCEIYEVVLIGGMKPYDFSKRKGVSASSVTQHIRAIQKKAKKFFVF